MNKIFQIGDFVFRLETPDEVIPPPNFMIFEIEGKEPIYTYRVSLGDSFPEPVGELAAKRDDLMVYQENELESRYIGVKGVPGFYACYQEMGEKEAHITLNPTRLSSLNIDPVFSSLLALERRQIEFNALILHCAYVEYNGEAILFSAPSETGKTTQANLWEEYKGARTVNGDRSLLQKIDDRWIAGGWPVCGTSEICHNEAIPVRAIVMLSQGKENIVNKMAPIRAFGDVYSQVTVNRWNRNASMKAMNLIEQLVTDVPVWHLSCTISQQAVQCLYDKLFSEGEERHD